MTYRPLLTAFAALLFGVAPAAAQEACKSTRLAKPAALADMYRMAAERAKAWKADARLVSMSTTALGHLKPDGTAAGWHTIFHSASANAWVSIDVANGTLTCYANPGRAGRMPDLKGEPFRDGAALYAVAREHGGDLIAQGYSVTIGTAAAPRTNHGTWNINFEKQDGRNANLMLMVGLDSGKLEKTIR